MSRKTGRGARRKLLWNLQNRLCAGCGERIYPHLRAMHPYSLTVDEVLPQAKGGSRVLGNQVAMHKRCNLRKADRMPNGCDKIWLQLVNAKLYRRGKIAENPALAKVEAI